MLLRQLLDGFRCYWGLDGDRRVAVATLRVEGDLGWLGMGGTLASHRRRGGQRALIERRLRDGLALGCRHFVCEAAEDLADKPNPSIHNLLWAGFRVAYARANFGW